MDGKFNMFMETVDERFRSFVSQINEYLTGNGCTCDIKLQKSGYVVSYVSSSSKRTLATFVSRKTGMKLRIYPEHIQEYQSFLDTLPEKVKKEIRKASACKRLINPDDCNPKCIMGYTFVLDGERHQKCRYMAFQLTLRKTIRTSCSFWRKNYGYKAFCEESQVPEIINTSATKQVMSGISLKMINERVATSDKK